MALARQFWEPARFTSQPRATFQQVHLPIHLYLCCEGRCIIPSCRQGVFSIARQHPKHPPAPGRAALPAAKSQRPRERPSQGSLKTGSPTTPEGHKEIKSPLKHGVLTREEGMGELSPAQAWRGLHKWGEGSTWKTRGSGTGLASVPAGAGWAQRCGRGSGTCRRRAPRPAPRPGGTPRTLRCAQSLAGSPPGSHILSPRRPVPPAAACSPSNTGGGSSVSSKLDEGGRAERPRAPFPPRPGRAQEPLARASPAPGSAII